MSNVTPDEKSRARKLRASARAGDTLTDEDREWLTDYDNRVTRPKPKPKNAPAGEGSGQGKPVKVVMDRAALVATVAHTLNQAMQTMNTSIHEMRGDEADENGMHANRTMYDVLSELTDGDLTEFFVEGVDELIPQSSKGIRPRTAMIGLVVAQTGHAFYTAHKYGKKGDEDATADTATDTQAQKGS